MASQNILRISTIYVFQSICSSVKFRNFKNNNFRFWKVHVYLYIEQMLEGTIVNRSQSYFKALRILKTIQFFCVNLFCFLFFLFRKSSYIFFYGKNFFYDKNNWHLFFFFVMRCPGWSKLSLWDGFILFVFYCPFNRK